MREGKNMGIMTTFKKPTLERGGHAGEGRFPRHLPVVPCSEERRQPEHRRPAPTAAPWLPVAREMPVAHRAHTHLDPRPAAAGHIVAPLREEHQITVPQALLGLGRQWHAHGALLSPEYAAWDRAEHWQVMG